MKKLTILRIIFTVTGCIAFIGIILASYIIKEQWHLVNIGFAYVGVYGVILLAFLLVQQAFSLINNRWWVPKLIELSKNTPKVGVQVVGYREDPALFRGCLLSLAKQDYEGIDRVVVGIDGN